MSDDAPQSLAKALSGDPGMLLAGLPHAKALGLRLLDGPEGVARALLPYSPDIIGDPETGVIHGGAVTALLDTVCGVAVMAGPARPFSTATLGLRVDYMRPATPGEDLIADAQCHRTTRHVAFVEATAYHPDAPERPIARASASFILESAPPKRGPAS